MKTLKCDGFEISVFAGGKGGRNLNYALMRDMVAGKGLKDRRKKPGKKQKENPSHKCTIELHNQEAVEKAENEKESLQIPLPSEVDRS